MGRDPLATLQAEVAAARRSQQRLGRLLAAVVAVSSDLDLDDVLQHLVAAACDVVGARYGALGVIGPDGRHLSQFITHGVSEAERALIGPPPQGHGVLGQLIRDPHPLRLTDLKRHPASVGFPAHHPDMTSFLGAPILVRGKVFGNLYLAEKHGAEEFDAEDEEILVALASAAGVAIENARLYERTVRESLWSEAVSDLTRTLLESEHEDDGLQRLAAMACERSLGSVALVALADDEGQLVLRAVCRAPGSSAREGPHGDREADAGRARGADAGQAGGADAGRAGGWAGESAWPDDSAWVADAGWAAAVATGSLLRFDAKEAPGIPDPLAARLAALAGDDTVGVAVPLGYTGSALGLLAVGWPADGPATAADSGADLHRFGEQAGLALLAATGRRDAGRMALLEDRERIARDMHDHVIQRLFATGLSLQTAARMTDREPVRSRLDDGVDELDAAIKDIRQAIHELRRPADVADLRQELQDVANGFVESLGFVPQLVVTGDGGAGAPGRGAGALSASLRADVLAVVREGLANVARHARALHAQVRVQLGPAAVLVEVRDDGSGIPPDAPRSGLLNLGHRAAKRGGELDVRAAEPTGTVLTWRVSTRP